MSTPLTLGTQDNPLEPVLTDNAMTVLAARYLLRDENGNVIETPAQMYQTCCQHDCGIGEDLGDHRRRVSPS